MSKETDLLTNLKSEIGSLILTINKIETMTSLLQQSDDLALSGSATIIKEVLLFSKEKVLSFTKILDQYDCHKNSVIQNLIDKHLITEVEQEQVADL